MSAAPALGYWIVQRSLYAVMADVGNTAALGSPVQIFIRNVFSLLENNMSNNNENVIYWQNTNN